MRRTTDIAVCYDFLPKIGGAHLWFYEVYRRWPSEVRVLTGQFSSERSEAEREREFDRIEHGSLRILREIRPLEQIDLLSPQCLRTFWSQAKSIGRAGDDGFVRLHALKALPEGFAAYLYKRLRPRSSRLITYAHGEEVLVARSSRQLKAMAKRVYAASDLIIANSENTKRIVLELCPRARVVCIHPGVDTAAFSPGNPDSRAYRARWNWPTDMVIVCTVGRMEPRKNQAAVIRAVSQLRQQGLPLAYVCAGSGPEIESLRQLAGELSLRDWVRFTGVVPESEKPLLYSAADLYAMPSIHVGQMIEGFGIVFLEAAAAGLPSVSGNTGGQPEAVLDGQTGLVIDGTRPDQVVAAVGRLARAPALRAQMGRAGRDWAIQHDWQQVVRKTLALIAGIE